MILSYTKLSGLSNDRSYYLNILDHVHFFGKIWGFFLTNKKKESVIY